MTTSGILVRKFERNLRDYGFGVALRKTLEYLFQFLYDSKVYRIYMIDLRECVPNPREDRVFTYKFIDRSDTDCIRQIEEMEEWLTGQVAKVLMKGGLGLVAMEKGRVAGFNLVDIGEIYMPLVNIRRVFKEREAWSLQITVDRKFRRMGLGSDLRHRMFGELKRRGFKKFYGGTLSTNEANLKLTRSVGFKEIADIAYFRFFSLKRHAYRRVS